MTTKQPSFRKRLRSSDWWFIATTAISIGLCLWGIFFGEPQEQKPKAKYDPTTDLLLITSMTLLLGS